MKTCSFYYGKNGGDSYMAKIINGSTSSSYWTFKLEVTENSTSITGNTSNVTVTAYIGRGASSGGSYMYGANIPCTISISSSDYSDSVNFTYSNSSRVDISAGSWLKIGSVNFPSVKHSNDGTSKITVSASFTNNISPSSGSASGTVTLTDIPRASSVSINGGVIGQTATITITSASEEYWHLLEYTFYSKSGSIVQLGAGVYTYDWVVPSSLGSEIPADATSGTGTLRCITYDKNDVEIGRKEISMQLSVLDVPTISEYTITIDESSEYADWGLFLSGYSRALVTAKATAYNGASISQFSVFISGVGNINVEPIVNEDGTYSLSYTTGIFTSGGEKTIGINATDSRGLTSSRYKESVTVHQCASPTISTFVVNRTTSDQSIVTVKCNWTFDEIGDNTTVGAIQYKEGKNGTYVQIKNEDGEVRYAEKGIEITLFETFEATKSYYFKLIVTDSLGGKDEKEAFISTRQVTFDAREGGKGFAFGKMSEMDAFEMAMDSQFYNPATFKEQVIEEYGHYTHLTWAGYENLGYIRIAKIIINSAWLDSYFIFDVIQRHHTFSTYYVGFKHINHADPDIAYFTYEGDAPAYLVKIGEGEWDLIVKKTERNDYVCVVDYKRNPYTNMDGRASVKWLDTYNEGLPETAIVSTPRKQNKVLWSGGNVGAFMSANKDGETHKCDLSKTPISQQPNGIVLAFSQYDQNNNVGLEDYMSFFVPKQLVAAQPGAMHTFQLNTYNYSAMGTKYLKISDTLIEGNIVNEDVGSANGVSYANNKFVLRYVYGV